MFASLLHRLPSLGRWPRLCAAAACLVLAAANALAGRAPAAIASPGRTKPVIVAQRDLAAGHTIRPGDVRVARWPPALAPRGPGVDGGEVIGRRVAGPVAAGEALAPTRLLGPGLTAGLAPGMLAAPVTLADPHAVQFLRAGDHVDLVAIPQTVEAAGRLLVRPGRRAPPEPPITIVTERALVLAMLGPDDSLPDPGLSEVVLAVDRSTTLRIEELRTSHTFAVLEDSP